MQMDKKTDRQKYTLMRGLKDRQKDGLTKRQTERQTDRQTERLTDS